MFDENTLKEVFAKVESLKIECVVICRGKLRERTSNTDKIVTSDVELYVLELTDGAHCINAVEIYLPRGQVPTAVCTPA